MNNYFKYFTKKEKYLLIFYFFMVLIITTGITYSYFLVADSAEKDSTKVYAGRLDVNYIQGNEVSTDILDPIEEPGFNTTKNVYRNRFGVSSDGTLEQTVSINFNILKNEFSNDMIRYAIYNSNGTRLSTGYLNQGFTTMIDNLYFKPVETREFVLIIWLESKPYEQFEQGNKLSGTIVIESRQYGY